MNVTTKGAWELLCGIARASEDIHYSRCRSDGCMMWRWNLSAGDSSPVPKTGYCGLAGKPEEYQKGFSEQEVEAVERMLHQQFATLDKAMRQQDGRSGAR